MGGNCSHEIKRRLFLGRKVTTNLDSILKCRDITLLTNASPVKAMVLPVIMYGCESWTVEKAEHQRIDAFELWCWRRLESPLDCKEVQPVHPKGNQSWICIGRTDVEAETQYFGHLMRRTDSFEKTLMLGGIGAGGEGDDRGWDGWMASLTRWMWVWVTPGVGDGQGGLACCDSWGHKESDTTEWLNWTELNWFWLWTWSWIIHNYILPCLGS